MKNIENLPDQENNDIENESTFSDEGEAPPITDNLFLNSYEKDVRINIENCIWHGLDCIDFCQYEEAIQIFNNGLKLDPNITDFWLFKGICYNKMNSPMDTLVCLEKIDWDIFFIHAQRLYRKNHFKKALRYFEKGLEINPTDPDLWDNKGSCLEQIGKTDEALLCYEHAKELDRL